MAPRTVLVSAPDPAAGHCQPTALLETPRHSQASLAVSCGFTVPFSWVRVTQGFVVPSESLFPWRFSVLLLDIQAGKFAVGPGTFTTARELFWYNCSPDCGSSAQLLHSGANGDLLQEYLSQTLFLTRLLQPEPLSPRQITADPCLPRRRSNIPRQVWLSLLWG